MMKFKEPKKNEGIAKEQYLDVLKRGHNSNKLIFLLIFIVLNVTSVHANYLDGMISYWSFDNSSNPGKDQYDSHDGVLYGTNWTKEGLVGGALLFDGTDDYISINASPDFNSNQAGLMTFSTFVKSDNYSKKQVILSRRHYCNNDGHFNIYTQDNRIYFSFYSDYDAVARILYSEKILRDGEPYQIFWLKKWNQTGTRLFVNGIERIVYGDTDTKGTSYADLPVFIGAQNGPGDACTTGGFYFFNGTIDEVAVWNRILSIEDMENFTKKTFSELTNYTVENDYVNLTINSLGIVTSLKYKYNQEEQLNDIRPLSKIYFNDGSFAEPESFTALGNDTFKIKYFGSDTQIILNIIPKQRYFIFTILDVSNLTDYINEIELFSLNLKHVPQRDKEWAVNSSSDELFLQFLPLQVETVCGDLSYGGYGCKASKWMGLVNRSGALLTSTKAGYYAAWKDLIADNNLPNVLLDGKWFRESDDMRESYLFAGVTQDNYLDLLNYAKRGKFRQFLAYNPIIYGHYDQPRSFPTQDAFYNAMDQFISNGIKIGIHSFYNSIEPNDSLFYPVNESLYKERIGTIIESISNNSSTVTVDNNLSQNKLFLHFVLESKKYSYKESGISIIIDNEILRCDSYNNNQLSDCARGQFTDERSHAFGTDIYVVPSHYGNFFINPDNDRVKNESTESFKALARRLNVSLIYMDATNFVDKPGMFKDTSINYKHKYGALPYLNKLDKFPPVQFGDDAGASYGWYYNGRTAEWDGVAFKNKEFTKNFKSVAILNQNPYSQQLGEFGWWKINGAHFSDGMTDFDSTTPDDIHYVMTKVLALNTSIGVQLYEYANYQDHALLNELFDLIGSYNTLINKDIETGIIPQSIKDYLKQPDNEAEIDQSGLNLIKKKVDKQYAVWNTTNDYTYNITNPFADQKLKIEIRPKFDYYPFDDSRHILISNFSNVSSSDISTSSNYISCDIDHEGRVDITNNGKELGGCKILISGSFYLVHKRGVGLSITGDGNGEEIIVHLASSTQAGVRDFDFLVNFTGKRELILGDPSGISNTYWDYNLSKLYAWDYSPFLRHADYYYNNNDKIAIYIIVNPGKSSLQLHSLKGLQEKGTSILVNPTVTINGESIIFPVNLSVDDTAPNILEYNGYTKQYKLYTPLYKLVSAGKISYDKIIMHKTNEINISSNTSNSDYSTRADIRISTYDMQSGKGKR